MPIPVTKHPKAKCHECGKVVTLIHRSDGDPKTRFWFPWRHKIAGQQSPLCKGSQYPHRPHDI